MKICIVDSCDRTHDAKGFCRKHYNANARHGDPLACSKKPLEQRFWAKVDKSGECWEWTGCKSGTGYGSIGAGAPSKKTLSAHRLSYEMANGKTPDGLVIDHMCRNRGCVNPGHLQAVPQKQNSENRGVVHSSTGVRGVFWNKGVRKYEARVRHNRKLHNAGLHLTIAEAEAAVIALRNSLHTNNLADRMAS